MITIERRALYNSLRMNWLDNPTLKVLPWQVEDYRAIPTDELFERIKVFSINLDKESIEIYSEEADSPEELTEFLIGEESPTVEEEDQIYLLIFELWRRLLSEKPSLSIFCNELDHQICLYDHDSIEDPIPLQDSIINLLIILEKNVDEGVSHSEAIELISLFCANDIASFLYDFIGLQIEEENEDYARELLEDFKPYYGENKWFQLLRARLSALHKMNHAQQLLSEIVEEYLEEKDVEFFLELLSFLIAFDSFDLVPPVAVRCMEIVDDEEDLRDLLEMSRDYFHKVGKGREKLQIETFFTMSSAPKSQFKELFQAR